MFLENKEMFPEIEGITFFGSRTISKEKPESDLDLNFFYDSSNQENEFDVMDLKRRLEEFLKANKIENVGAPEISTINDLSESDTLRGLYVISFNLEFHNENPDSLPTFEEQRIISRFFLGIGTELYKNRNFIFDTLEKMPNGDEIWKSIISLISCVERSKKIHTKYDVPAFLHYPETVAEARKFFLNLKSGPLF